MAQFILHCLLSIGMGFRVVREIEGLATQGGIMYFPILALQSEEDTTSFQAGSDGKVETSSLLQFSQIWDLGKKFSLHVIFCNFMSLLGGGGEAKGK